MLKHQIESKITQLNEDLQINEHDGSFSLNEFIPSEAVNQSSEEKSFDYSKILNKDLSDFTGVWENGRGERFTLNSNGTFSNMEIPDMDGLVSENSDYFRYVDNEYKWFINFIMEDASFRVSLIPIGVEFIHYNSGKINTNTAKDRIYFEFGGGERFATSNDVYYR